MTPDPARLGGIDWLERTNGRLSPGERRSLAGAIAKAQLENLAGRLKLLTGRRPNGLPHTDVDLVTPPDSRLARTAEEACEGQDPVLVEHSYRTWLYGRLLAHTDVVPVDPELFYASCLLHDVGLGQAVTGEDFTLRSARRADACVRAAEGVPEQSRAIQDAISVHTLPGISVERDGALGTYLQAGAMLDLSALRSWDLPSEAIRAVRDRHPADGLTDRITAAVRAECEAVPDGRFALITRWGFLLAVRLAR